MIVIRITMTVRPEKQKEVLQTLLTLVETPGKESGCLSYGIYCDIKDENVFNLISEWKSRRYLNHYMRTDRFGVLLGTKSLLSEPLDFKIFRYRDIKGIESVNSVRKKMKLEVPMVMPRGHRLQN